GENTAQQALATGQVMILKEQIGDVAEDRTRLRYSLGLPLQWGTDSMGALVFVRYGGPSFKPDQIRLSEFIAVHVAQLLGRKYLAERVGILEAERRLDRLQEDFIATVSHELLTPLGFIKGYATTLMREDANWDDETRHEFLTIIDEESDRLKELIENFMDSSRLQAGTLRLSFQPVKLDTFLRDMQQRASARADDFQIILDLNSPGLQLQADATRLAQVFDNLISNAMKYASGSALEITQSADEDYAYISVKDHGVGIPPEYIDRVFERFYRVPSDNISVRGTGLGLFISRRIVEAHHGEITVQSVLGEGTTFNIKLPLKQTTAENSISLRESEL
ncbi:MAG: HAMP domain-containing histidine kinase, partial [Anaerolineales bacterium]|nr:HAMP domain-containing histidine kinase [Anaerolineales bacterium]